MTALTIAGVVLIVAGLAAFAIDSGFTNGGPSVSVRTIPSRPGTSPTVTGGPSSEPTASSSPNGSSPIVPTATPTPKRSARPNGFALVGSQIVYYASDGTSVPMPAIEGLIGRLVEGRALYYAIAPNGFGLRAGYYGGEFVPNVTMEQANGSRAQTGGVVLAGPVVSGLIAARLAAIAVPADRWVVALPVDIRGTTEPVDVGFDNLGLHGWQDTPRVVVRYSGSLRITEIVPSNAGYHVLVEGLGVTTWQVIDPARLKLSENKLDPDHLMNELLIYGNGTPSLTQDVAISRPVPVGRTMLLAAEEVSVSLVVRESRADIEPDHILRVVDVPVFAASS